MTEFTTWRSLVDGAVISDIPDADLYYPIDEGSGDTLNDSIGSRNATSVGSLVWVEDQEQSHGWLVELDDTNYVELTESFIDPDTDFSVGIEISVGEEGFDGDATFWNWGDGDERFAVGYRADESEIGTEDPSDDHPAHPEPDPPYTIDLFLTWDAENNDAELFLNESSSTTTNAPSTRFEDKQVIGARGDGGRDMQGQGVVRYAEFDEVVSPSEFTL